MPDTQKLEQALMALPCSGYDPAPAFAPTPAVEVDWCRALALLPPNFGGGKAPVLEGETGTPVSLFRYTS